MKVARTDANGLAIDPKAAPAHLQTVAKYLISKDNIKVHEGVFHGVRVEYFKGKRAVDALLKDKFNKSIKQPEIATRHDALQLMTTLMESHNFFFRVDKQAQRVLDVAAKQVFSEDEEAYYVWQWESPWNRIKSMALGVGLISIVLIGVMFPLWPMSMRVGVWYLSMGGVGLIGALFVTAIVRLIVYGVSLAIPATRPGLWLFPNLFADVGFVDSFIPVWGWQGVDYESAHRAKYLRQKEQAAGGGKKRIKRSESKVSQGSDRASSSRPSTSDSAPLLEPATNKHSSVKSDDDEWTDEIVEELEADEKPKSQ